MWKILIQLQFSNRIKQCILKITNKDTYRRVSNCCPLQILLLAIMKIVQQSSFLIIQFKFAPTCLLNENPNYVHTIARVTGKKQHSPRLDCHMGHISLLDSLGRSTRFYTFGNPQLRGNCEKITHFRKVYYRHWRNFTLADALGLGTKCRMMTPVKPDRRNQKLVTN